MLSPTCSRQVVVSRANGLHVRPCMAIANAVTDAGWQVQVRHGGKSANAGSVLELMLLGAGQGAELTLESSGPDGEQALDALVALFGNNFGLPAGD